ncbi:MAG: signal peptidase I [Bdellovibrionales bacterium]|nr:signal peptidase I [Bdellovibrionales bacterium]
MGFLKQNTQLIIMIAALFAVRWSVIEPYVVPTGSMEPTLKTGDRLYALKCAYDFRIPMTNHILFRTGKVKRGDVILFEAPRTPEITYVKRAIGLPGDKISFREGVLYVNGQEIQKNIFPTRQVMYDIEEKEQKNLYLENLTGKKHYVILDNKFDRAPSRFMDEIQVPEGYLFAVGDNRDHSYDSRYWGFVPMENLKGQAMFIWYSSWDPNVKESMTSTSLSVPERIFYYGYEFFKFFPDYIKGEAWIRNERIGTFIR